MDEIHQEGGEKEDYGSDIDDEINNYVGSGDEEKEFDEKSIDNIDNEESVDNEEFKEDLEDKILGDFGENPNKNEKRVTFNVTVDENKEKEIEKDDSEENDDSEDDDDDDDDDDGDENSKELKKEKKNKIKADKQLKPKKVKENKKDSKEYISGLFKKKARFQRKVSKIFVIKFYYN